MSTHRLDYESHQEALRRECELIVDAGGEDLGVPVPTCPEWRLSDLLGHLGDVFSFWRVQLEAGSPEVPTEPGATGVPPGAGLVDWLEGTCADLQGALAERDPEEPCWNWSGADLTAGWVCRRMALEAAVHRYDTELAVSSPTPIARELAIDGIDEWISVHLATDIPEAPDANLGGVLCLACLDDAAAWTVEIAAGRLRWREGRGPADAVLVGPASDLYLYCWNRRSLEALELTGSRDVALAWTSLPI
ncbi:MAG: maleylpyruvate isomerase family mycothiol-dependent enzyme [Acidimicrobiales bacterium]